MSVRAAIVLLICLLAGCAAPSPTPAPTIVLSANLADGSEKWRRDAEHRFGRGVVVLVCHGSDRGGRWTLTPDAPLTRVPVQFAGERLRRAFPGRPIVLVSCNPGAFELHGLRGVFYCRRDVVIPPYEDRPDLAVEWASRAAGSIWEFSDHE